MDSDTNRASPYRPLLLDLGLPLGLYYGLHDGAGLGIVLSLVIASVAPAVRELVGIAPDRRINALAALMLVTYLAGIVSSLISGDARLVFAKDSLISSTIAVAILVSVWRGRPLMSEGLQAFIARGQATRVAAWDRLHASSRRFRGLESRYSVIWGLVLLADCAARVVGAFTLPVSTMAWASTVILVVAIVIASILSGVLFARPMQSLVDDEADGDRAVGVVK